MGRSGVTLKEHRTTLQQSRARKPLARMQHRKLFLLKQRPGVREGNEDALPLVPAVQRNAVRLGDVKN